MGYYSDYNGEFKPTKELTKNQETQIYNWFVKRFGKEYKVLDRYCDCHITYDTSDNKWYSGDIYFDPDSHEVCPVCFNMKGYHFEYQLYEFVQFAKSIGVHYSGEVERIGEKSEDYEKYKIEDDKVLSLRGKIVYDETREVEMNEEQYEAMIHASVSEMIHKEVK